jgi:CRP-like cAMP-binding protein
MKKILLIEDNKIMRENTAELLQLVGYETEVAENGKVGIIKTKSFLPDLIICDIMMPELDGYSVLHLLSKDKDTASIPFILLTAKSEKSDIRQGMNLGADDFLTKPFQDIDLLNAVESRLKKHTVLKEQYENNADEVHLFLKDTANDFSLDYLIENYDGQHYKPKELLYRDGEYGHYLYLINEGQVKTYMLNEDGKKFITGIFKPGDFFGYKPLLEDRTYNDFSETMQECQIYKIPKADFLSLIHKNSDVAEKFIKLISKNLSEKEEELIQLAYSSVRKRIANKLKEIVEDTSENFTSISRTDLANMVGTAKETLVRTLSEFKDDKIIDTDGSKITILDMRKLNELLKSW